MKICLSFYEKNIFLVIIYVIVSIFFFLNLITSRILFLFSATSGSDIASDLSRLRQSSVTHTELEDTTDNLRTELRSAMHDMQQKFSAQLQSMEQDHNSRMDSMKESFEAQIQDLMEEIDQEKKIRLSTEVELERIRKLVSKH